MMGELSLLKVSIDELSKRQAEDLGLKPVFEHANSSKENDEINKKIIVVNKLFKKHQDHVGDFRKQIVIPKEFRARIMSLIHENTSGHLGVTKTKDKLGRHFFWPKCYKDVEEYVRSCDSCQRAGKPNEKKEAPLKLVQLSKKFFQS
ncbi:Transposon Ty3-I Gag-Pol polyprotein like [Argiope bruennichi]|uniref:RNA-directed DNA polymerase n=1 Tax=Argiope bruennichi TaxID=94029 RepID=A0A8T0E168_ARGBR|nr:Transposon Ty3-I Gag-Pol polyprotein like [Argiope bruennichi]